MTDEEQTHFNLRYLDKVRRLYPHGIPESSITTRHPSKAPPRTVCTFIVLSDSETISQPLSALLDAIQEKGARVPRENCVVQIVVNNENAQARLEELQASANSDYTVVLGGPYPSGTVRRDDRGVFLFSHSLSAIAESAASKREFWTHLQAVFPRI